MDKKIVIVGGVAGGASAAARLRRLNEHDSIIMFEKGPHVSFSNCCLPYHLSGIVENAEELVLMTPELFKSQYKIDAVVNTEVISIDRENKQVAVKNHLTGKSYNESYDKLILSPGAKPIVPPIKGIDSIDTFTVRNVVDIDKLKKHINKEDIKNISVIGGGFIGIEVAENLKEAGFDVSLIEAMPQLLMQFDYDMVQILHREMYDQGVNLIVNDKVVAFEKKYSILESGKKVKSDIVVIAIGVTPETDLAVHANLKLGLTGAICTDANYLTSDPDIYAVGDAIEVYNALSNKYFKLPLAGPAQKQARSVADHINNKNIHNKGFIGSSVIKIFDFAGAATGLSEKLAKSLGFNCETVKNIPNDKVGLMCSSEPVHFKLVFEIPTGRILGAQAIGKGNIDKRVDVIATAIKFGATIEDLRDLELCYAPPFGTGKDVVNFAGYIAGNLMNGDFKQVHAYELRDLISNKACIIDVREKDEYEESHIIGALNFPLSEIRERLDEIPKDKPLYLHCRSGQRSYNAVLMLQQKGYKNVFNISGGFMGLSYFEYFNDKTMNREKIVTNYNFE